MKLRSLNATIALMALLGTLAACGGGGDDEAGSPTAFSVQPATFTVTAATGSPAGQCGAFYVADFHVYGGTAPYRLDNSVPDAVLLHKSMTDLTPVSTVSERGGSFSVTFTGFCIKPATVIIVDKLDNQVVLTLNNEPAS